MKKKLLIVAVVVLIMVVFKNPICLEMMDIVDFIGMKAGANVVDIIDMLNAIYYI